MPISKFAKKIADHLISYLDKKNTSKLPEGYQYDADNEALLQAAEKSLGHVAMHGLTIAGSLFSAGLSQGMSLWSSKPPTPAKHSPSESSSDWGLAIPKHYGPVGVDRAVTLAKSFGLLDQLGRGDSVVTILKQSGEGRSSDLFGELGFDLLPQNILPKPMTQDDCIHICDFILLVVDQPMIARSELVEGLIKLIITEANILDDEIMEERTRLETRSNPAQGMAIGDRSSSSRSPLLAPDKLWKPEYAHLKLIFEWAARTAKILPSDKPKDQASSAASSIVSRMYLKSKSAQTFIAQGTSSSSINSVQSSASGSSSARSSHAAGSAHSATYNGSSTTLLPEIQESKDKALQFLFD